MTLFTGLSGFPLTSADEHGRVDVGGVKLFVRRLADAGADSIGLLGSTGSYPYLARDERRRAVEAAVAEADGETPVMVGIGALRTDHAIRNAEDAQAAGAEAVLLAPMSYQPLTQEEVFAHFEAVAAATKLPLCIYNNPTATHFTFTPKLIARLARLPTVAAIKMPAPQGPVADDLAALRAITPAGFSIGYSGDWCGAEALLAGADAWYSVLGGLFPEVCMAIRRAVRADEADEAKRLDARLHPLWALFKAHGGYRVVYAIANRIGLTDTAPPRPVLPLPAEAQAKVFQAIKGLGLDAPFANTRP